MIWIDLRGFGLNDKAQALWKCVACTFLVLMSRKECWTLLCCIWIKDLVRTLGVFGIKFVTCAFWVSLFPLRLYLDQQFREGLVKGKRLNLNSFSSSSSSSSTKSLIQTES